MRNLTKKTAFIAIAATAILVASVAAAFAAPVLPYGMTSYPGMSGNCSSCHSYAPAPTTPPVVTPPVVTPPVVSGHDSEGDDAPVVKKAESEKKEVKKAKKHHKAKKARRAERD